MSSSEALQAERWHLENSTRHARMDAEGPRLEMRGEFGGDWRVLSYKRSKMAVGLSKGPVSLKPRGAERPTGDGETGSSPG